MNSYVKNYVVSRLLVRFIMAIVHLIFFVACLYFAWVVWGHRFELFKVVRSLLGSLWAFPVFGMIYTYMGTPGSGKSYHAMKIVIDNLKKGRTVYTNIDGSDENTCRTAVGLLADLDDYELSRRYVHLTENEVRNLPQHFKTGGFYVIDEIHEHFGNRDWNTDQNKEFIKWAKSHRHHGVDLLMLTTDIEGVDKQVRRLSEWTYVLRKMNYMGSMVKNVYEIGAYIGDKWEGTAYNKAAKKYDPKIYACYKSYVEEGTKETGVQKHVNIFKKPIFFILPVVLCFALYMIFFKSSIGSGGIAGTLRGRNAKIAAAQSIPQGDGKKAESIMFPKPLPVFEYRKLVGDRLVVDGREKVAPVESGRQAVLGAHGAGLVPVRSSGGESEGGVLGDSYCRVTGEIESDGNKLTIEVCDDMVVKKKNGTIYYSKKERKPIDEHKLIPFEKKSGAVASVGSSGFTPEAAQRRF